MGILVGLPLGQFFTTRRRRWLVAALLNLEVIASGIAGGWWALAFTATAAALTFCVSAFILRDLYEGSEWAALRHHFNLAFGLVRGFQIIDEGKTVVPSGKLLLLAACRRGNRDGNVVGM